MPAAVLTILLGVTGLMSPGVVRAAGVALLLGALVIVPARLRLASTMNKMPEYGVLVAASRDLVRQQRPIRGLTPVSSCRRRPTPSSCTTSSAAVSIRPRHGSRSSNRPEPSRIGTSASGNRPAGVTDAR